MDIESEKLQFFVTDIHSSNDHSQRYVRPWQKLIFPLRDFIPLSPILPFHDSFFLIFFNFDLSQEVTNNINQLTQIQEHKNKTNRHLITLDKMLFKNLLQASNDVADTQLADMQRDLKSKIEKAKTLISTCKVSRDTDDTAYNTTVTGELIFPDFKADINYNEEFWKTYLKNEISFAMIKELSEKTNSLQEQVKDIEALQEDYFRFYKLKNRKKNRRLAVEIQKKHTCPYEKCYKIYGSDVSLNLHIKLKHNGGNKTDREKLAEEICIAQQKGEPLPEMRLNLPPGYLQEYRQNLFNKRQIGENGEPFEKHEAHQQEVEQNQSVEDVQKLEP